MRHLIWCSAIRYTTGPTPELTALLLCAFELPLADVASAYACDPFGNHGLWHVHDLQRSPTARTLTRKPKGWALSKARPLKHHNQNPPSLLREDGGYGEISRRLMLNCTAPPARQCRSNPVSSRRLPETGIFQISAGDYRRFLPGSGQIWSLETDRNFAKARHWRAFLVLLRAKSLGAGLVGWGARIRTSIWRIGIGCSRLSERSRRTSFR